MPSAAVTVHVPDGSSHTADGDRGVEAHVAPEVEPVDDVVEVALGLGLPGEVLLPLPLVEQLLREEVAVGVALGVEPGARVAVPEPGAADAAAGLEQQRGEAGFARAVQLVDAGDAGADDQHVDVGGAVPALVPSRDVLYRPVSLRPTTYSRRGAPRGDRGSEVVGAPGALRDGGPRPGAQGALLRPGLLRDSRPSSSGRGSGRWRAGSRRSRSRATSSSTRSSTSRSSCVRTDDMGVRGVPERLPPPRRQGRRGPRDVRRAGSPARSTGGATASTARTPRVTQRRTFAEHNLQPDDIDLVPVRCEMWGGCAWINLDDDAPPLRQCLEPAATILDAWKVESLRTEWWYACRLPVNWKLAERGVRRAVPRGRDAPAARHPRTRYAPRDGAPFDPQAFIDAEHPVPAHDERRHGRDGARRTTCASPRACATSSCPADADAGDGRPGTARSTTRSCAGTATRGHDIPDLNELEARGHQRADVLPLLPALLRAADVQQRVVVPLPPARTGGDADGDLVARPGSRRASEPAEADAARGVGVRRSAVAADPRAGLLEPAAAAEGPAREGLRVHAPVRAGSRATSRTSSGRSTASSPASPTSSCSRRCRRST